MPSCFVKSCSISWRSDKEILHVFPRNRDRIGIWLEKLNIHGQEFEYLLERIATSQKGRFRICSRHFKETDYNNRGPQKFLKNTAYPSLNLENISESSTTSLRFSGAEVEHNYHKRLRTDGYKSSESTTNTAESNSGRKVTVVETSPEKSDYLQGYASQITNCNLEESQFVDCILDSTSESIYFNTEHSLDIPLSHTQTQTRKHCKICPHGLTIPRNSKIKKINRGIQCAEPTFSIGTQCSLVELPPLTLLPVKETCFLKIENLAPSSENILQSSFSKNMLPEHTSDPPAIQENKYRVHHDPNIYIVGLPPNQRLKQEHVSANDEELYQLDSSIAPQNKIIAKDTSYYPSQEVQVKSEEIEDEELYVDSVDPDLSFVYLPPDKGRVSMARQKKFLVFEECLDKLLMNSHCLFDPRCTGIIIELRKYMVGSALVVYAECSNKHKFKLWNSQPFIGHMPVGNLLISSAILCSGSNFFKMQNFFSVLDMLAISTATHYNNQRKYLFPTIQHHWTSQRNKIIEKIGHKAVALIGDGQCETSGFDAKYCTYTLIDAETNCIIDFQVNQLQPGRSSVSLETLTFIEALDRIIGDHIKVKVIATDKPVSIGKIIRQKYPCIKHEFDVWHMAKSIEAKLDAASKKSTCRELSGWVSLVKNHLWWALSTCQNNPTLLKEKWLSVSYHSANVHEWTGNTLYHRCSHPLITGEEERVYEWLTPGSAALYHLNSIVQDPRLLKYLEHLSGFYHTGEVEVFHSMVLKYRSKRFFYLDAMVARTQLAAMDHNTNISRLQAEISKPKAESEETLRFHCGFSKAKKDWVVRKIYRATSQDFVKDIISDAVDYAAGIKSFQWNSRQSTCVKT